MSLIISVFTASCCFWRFVYLYQVVTFSLNLTVLTTDVKQ